MKPVEIPLFPLRTVLFPDGHLALRIFEQRYLNMVRECTSADSGFGVCLIVEGEEALSPVRTANTGTLAHIVDWFTLEDGLLGVTAIGSSRFHLVHSQRQDDGLLRGQVSWLNEPPETPLPEAYSVLAEVLTRFMEKVGKHYPSYSPQKLEDACWVGYRLAELLPITAIEKQHLLEMNDPLARLQDLLEILPRFQSD